MAPTVCITETLEDHTAPFSLHDHLMNLKTAFKIGDGIRTLRIRRRPRRILRLRNSKANLPIMGLVVDECQQSLSFDEDSRGLPYSSDNEDSVESDTSNNNWPKNSSEYYALNMQRRQGLIDITVRTIALIRRNQQLQLRLNALHDETRAFVQSVLKNPENQPKLDHKTYKLNQNNEESVATVK